MMIRILSEHHGAAGRPFLSHLVTLVHQYRVQGKAPISPLRMAFSTPTFQVNGLPSVAEDVATSNSPSPDRAAVKLNMLRKMRPPPFKYAWSFFHDKNTNGADYEKRLTELLNNIITIKSFWELMNDLPLDKLQMKDTFHFFKRGVKPVWEDPRNVKGGSWTFRVPKAQSEEFWKEVLLLAVGEQFADVIEQGKPSFLSIFYPFFVLSC